MSSILQPGAAVRTFPARTGRERVRTIDSELLFQEIRSGRHVTIVDVRDHAAFRGPSGRIPGSISMPIHQLAARSEELSCDRSQSIVVVSARGNRSQFAVLELELAGFTEVQSLEGGLHRWIQLGLPVAYSPATDKP